MRRELRTGRVSAVVCRFATVLMAAGPGIAWQLPAAPGGTSPRGDRRVSPPAGVAPQAARSREDNPRTVHDARVVPAVGTVCLGCGPGGCRHGHHPGCREGRCVPSCPVRPDHFGYYGTRWRRWPGQDVVAVSGDRDATPILPPRLAVPEAGEESMRTGEDREEAVTPERAGGDEASDPRGAAPLPAEFPPGDRGPAIQPGQRAAAEPEPAPRGRKSEAERKTEPGPDTPPEAVVPQREPAPPKPLDLPRPDTPQPAPAPPEDENLFEAGSGGRARRTFPVAPPAGKGEVVPAAHGPILDPKTVPAAPFDPRAETRRLRGGR